MRYIFTNFLKNLLPSVNSVHRFQNTSIPERVTGCMEHDSMSMELTKFIYEYLHVDFGGKFDTPFIVINTLHRNRLDPNRKLTDACAEESGIGGQTWKYYHSRIEGIYFLKN